VGKRDQERERDQERKQTCHLRAQIAKIGGGFDELACVGQFLCKVRKGPFVIKELTQSLDAFGVSDRAIIAKKKRSKEREGD